MIKIEASILSADFGRLAATRAGHRRLTVVRYEHLATQPTEVQAWLGARLGLPIRELWVQCGQRFDCRDSHGVVVRSEHLLGADRIGQGHGDYQRFAEAIEITPELERWCRELGYEPRCATSPVPLATA